jgi:hypothetical protein
MSSLETQVNNTLGQITRAYFEIYFDFSDCPMHALAKKNRIIHMVVILFALFFVMPCNLNKSSISLYKLAMIWFEKVFLYILPKFNDILDTKLQVIKAGHQLINLIEY